MIAALALAVALAADVASFRAGGAATWPAPAPSFTPCWTTPLPGWSNASPVVVGDLVCAMSEPTTVVCLDRASGRERWRATNDHLDTVPAAERATWERRLGEARAREERLAALQRRYGQLRKELRAAPTDATRLAELEAAGRELATLRTAAQADAPYLTPPDREILGYTTASPTSDGTRVFVLTGAGVVSAFDLAGRRLWSRALGPAPSRMRGYHVGTAASPLVAHGLLIVPHGTLRALDPATGADRWSSVPYADYGTPAVGQVGRTWFVATPNGELVRLDDGVVLADGLASPWFVGPAVAGDEVWWIGANASHVMKSDEPAWAVGVRVRETAPGQLAVERRVRTAVPTKEPMYTSPVVLPDALVAVDVVGGLWRIDRGTGSVSALGTVTLGPAYTSPQLVGGELWLGGESGRLARIAPRAGSTPALSAPLGLFRSTPVVAGGRAYLRTVDGVTCLEGSP